MRKIFLIIIMLLTFCSCGNTSKDEPRDLGYLGTWYFDKLFYAENFINTTPTFYSFTCRGQELAIDENELTWSDQIFNYSQHDDGYLFYEPQTLSNSDSLIIIKVLSYSSFQMEIEVRSLTKFYNSSKTTEKSNYVKKYSLLKESIKGSFDDKHKKEYFVTALPNTNDYDNLKNHNIISNYSSLLNNLVNENESLLIEDEIIEFVNSNIILNFNYSSGLYLGKEKDINGLDIIYTICVEITQNNTIKLHLKILLNYSGDLYEDGELINVINCSLSYSYLLITSIDLLMEG